MNFIQPRKYFNYLILALFLFPLASISAQNLTSNWKLSNQMILVLTDSITATNGYLYYYERENSKLEWKLINSSIKIVLGRNGLGLGLGLHNLSDLPNIPVKKEGDSRSPAGVFNLSSVFGYNLPEQMKELKMPYFNLSEMVECIDDADSKYYNRLISKDKIEELKAVDWNSSEKMSAAGIYYELGVVVDHNINSEKALALASFYIIGLIQLKQWRAAQQWHPKK